MGKGCRAGPENAEGSTFICINKNRKGSVCPWLCTLAECPPSIRGGGVGGGEGGERLSLKPSLSKASSEKVQATGS